MTSVSPTRGGYPADLRALTSLRAFLAVGVVMFHYQLQWDPALGFSPIIERSRLAVDAFFMLSGFILAHVYGPAFAAGTVSYRRFIVARAAGVQYDPATYTAEGFFKTLLLVQAWFPSLVDYNWSGPSWSLSAEWFAYLLFPGYALIAMKLKTRPWALLFLGVLGFVVIDAIYGQVFGKVLPRAEDDMGILRILPEFLIGMALYGLGRRWQWSRGSAISASAVATLCLLLAMQFSLDDRLVIALAAPLILTWSMLARTAKAGPLSAPLAVFSGEASFALYLVHMPLLVAYKGVASELRGIDSSFYMSPLELAGLFVVTMVVAAALHLGVEKPGRRWIRRRFESRRPDARAREPE